MNELIQPLLMAACLWPIALVLPAMNASDEALAQLMLRLNPRDPMAEAMRDRLLDEAEAAFERASNRYVRHTLLALVAIAAQMLAVNTLMQP